LIRSAITVSLVPQSRGGPFVFWDDLGVAFQKAAALGFDAVEIFPPGPELFEEPEVQQIIERSGVTVAAVGTGAGFVVHKLTLTDPDRAKREQARDFIGGIVRAAGDLGASAIVGSMQGRWGGVGLEKDEATFYLADALSGLGDLASTFGVPLLYEPLNRYETNMANRMEDAVRFVESLQNKNVKILADLFHMSIEEADLPAAIRLGANTIGHIHFADSNRRPPGCGHTNFAPIAAALREVGYEGYMSAECLPHPDPDAAAKHVIDAYRKFFSKDVICH
jgi:sugar phosphate isomerase/epimerase